MKNTFAMIIFAAFLSGCSNSYTPQQIGAFPENYEAQWRQYLAQYAIDPESVKTSINRPTLRQGGWYTCAVVNAKNRMGGYSGNTVYRVVYRGGVIVDAYENNACLSQ